MCTTKSKKTKAKKMVLVLLCSIVAVIAATYVVLFGFLKNINEWYYVTMLGKKKDTLPPGDMGWPLIGNIVPFFKAFNSQDPDTFVENLITRYGKTGIYKTHLFGSPSIIVCSPDLCRKALADEHVLFGYPTSAKRIAGKKSLYGISISQHKRLRKIVMNPINGDEALASHIELIESIVTTSLDELSSMNKPIDFFHEMKKVTLKVISQIFLGSIHDSILSSMVKCYSDLFPGIVSMPVNLPGFVFYKSLEARKTLLKIFKDRVDEVRREKTTKHDREKGMIDLLIEAEDDDGEKLDDEHVFDLLLIFLFAGHETAAHTAMWATIYLHHHPEMLQKAKDEQMKVMKRRPSSQNGLTLNEIKQMEYLPKVIDESLRRANFAFTLFRKVETDVNLSGYTIPKGWNVLVWSRAIHMDPTIYPNPKEFIPSRWEMPGLKGKNFIPFGGGSRICPGSDLGKLEVSIFLHHFLLNYKLEELNPMVPVITLPLTRPADNCIARIIKLT